MTLRPAVRGDLPVAGLWALAAASVAAGALLADRYAITAECAFRSVTGLACPTCGLTRALGHVSGGRWLEALALNPLAVAGVAAFLACGVAAPFWVLLRAPVPAGLTGLPRPLRAAAALLFAANWIYLIAAGV